MKLEIKEKLPSWYQDINSDDTIILTDDIDALLSYYFLNKKFNVEVAGFYNFKSIYFNNKRNKSMIGVDMETIKGRIFGNHLTNFYKNEDAINLNNYCNVDKYYKKYSLSTTILICSLYDIDLESMTDEQLKILLAVDVGFKGYYSDFFKPYYLKWLDRLDYRFLEDRILKKHTIDEMYEVIKDYGLHEHIKVNADGKLHTKIKLDKLSDVFDDIIALPQDKFILHKNYETISINPMNQALPPKDKVLSMAWIFKNKLKLTIK